MNKAFVAGATGYTGRAVVAELRALGLETTAHIRPNSPQRERWTREFADLGACSRSCQVTPLWSSNVTPWEKRWLGR